MRAEPAALCRCGHFAIDHHFNNWQEFKGQGTRGKCSRNTPMEPDADRCPCVGFAFPNKNARPEVAP